MIDVDYFKQVNDSHGHQKGDEILKAIAASIENEKRDYDFLARFGGEEFLLWLPNSDKASATKICDRIRKSIEKLSLLSTPITISIGLALYTSTDTQKITAKDVVDTKNEIDRILSQADKALYAAKNAGRNCIYWFEASS
jgi:diguanylate cyclase (GGDEF)-like protein